QPMTSEQKALLRHAKTFPVLLTQTPDGISFSHANGDPAHEHTVVTCIQYGWLVGQGDHLLPGWSQSYAPSRRIAEDLMLRIDQIEVLQRALRRYEDLWREHEIESGVGRQAEFILDELERAGLKLVRA